MRYLEAAYAALGVLFLVVMAWRLGRAYERHVNGRKA